MWLLKFRYMMLFVVLFAVMLLVNIQHLGNPPYWDDITGLHNQALWIAANDFDIFGLWKQKSFLAGGSLIYPMGIIPWFYGLLYWSFSPQTVHILGHIFNIACLAAAATVFVIMLRRYTDGKTALLYAAVALTEPVMSGRMAALGQESPLLLSILISLCYFQKGSFRRAYVFAALAFFVKPTGIILLLAYLCYWLLYNVWFYWKKRRLSRHVRQLGISALLVLAGIVLSMCFSGEALGFAGLPLKLVFIRLWGHIYYFHSLFAPKLALCGVVAIYILIRKGAMARRKLFSLLLLIFIAGFWVAYSIHGIPIPRYVVITVFPVMFLLAANMNPKLARITGGVFLVLHCVFWFYNWFPALPEDTARTGSDLERSREYLEDLRANINICRILEEQAFDTPIVVKWPFVQMLTVPEFGYVSNPLPNVYCVGVKPDYCDVKVFEPGMPMPPETRYIYVPHCYRFFPSLKPEHGDLIRFADQTLPGTIYIYSKGK